VTAAGRGPVVCAALNPALDITYVSQRFVTGEANRVGRVHTRPGGKAVNVARLLSQAGHDVLVTGFAGGLVGDEIARELAERSVPHSFTRCAAGTRRTVSAFGVDDAAATGYNESGPPITAAEWEQFTADFAALIGRAEAVVLSGPPPRPTPGPRCSSTRTPGRCWPPWPRGRPWSSPTSTSWRRRPG
jgi:tagatose 6-phosphate kinase